MATAVAEHFDDQIRRAVHDRGNGIEIRNAIDEPAEPHNPADTLKAAGRRLHLRQQVEGANPRRRLAGFVEDGSAELAAMCRIDLTVRPERQLAGDDEEIAGDYVRHVSSDRRRRFWQNKPEV